MRVFLHETARATPMLLVERSEGRSSLMVIEPNGPTSERWTLPETASELVTRDSVIEELSEALESAKLSKQARSVVEKLLEDLPR